MFFTGTLGIIIGGPLAIIIVSAVSPDIIGGSGPDSVWRGLSTVAGSWIGGGANQAAMKEVFEVNDSIFSNTITHKKTQPMVVNIDITNAIDKNNDVCKPLFVFLSSLCNVIAATIANTEPIKSQKKGITTNIKNTPTTHSKVNLTQIHLP